jgi:hypothetical protein
MTNAPKFDYKELSDLLNYSEPLQERTIAVMVKALRALVEETQSQKLEIEALKKAAGHS